MYPFRAGIQTWICGEGTRHGQNMASSDLCGDAVFVCILKPSFGIQVTNTIQDFVILETKFLIKHMQLIKYNFVHYFQWRKYDGPLQSGHLLRPYVGTRSRPQRSSSISEPSKWAYQKLYHLSRRHISDQYSRYVAAKIESMNVAISFFPSNP